jgi:hypothetical protein
VINHINTLYFGYHPSNPGSNHTHNIFFLLFFFSLNSHTQSCLKFTHSLFVLLNTRFVWHVTQVNYLKIQKFKKNVQKEQFSNGNLKKTLKLRQALIHKLGNLSQWLSCHQCFYHSLINVINVKKSVISSISMISSQWHHQCRFFTSDVDIEYFIEKFCAMSKKSNFKIFLYFFHIIFRHTLRTNHIYNISHHI